MPDLNQQIAENVSRVRERMADAAHRSGRDIRSVRLVAVTKYVGADEARALLAAGCYELGESRPQELWKKSGLVTDAAVRWHLIGHLQRNKVRRTLSSVELIHSGDSLRLLEMIDAEAARDGTTAEVLLEVNISGDPDKHGFAPDQMSGALPAIAQLPHVKVLGLMAMAARGTDCATARADFGCLRSLRDRLHDLRVPGISLEELSMGMSGDFETAIEEGATIVRVGKALFSGVQP
ncbi:MAG: YggS family pyridoxal phosphate-dependent enzyme [Planctomycetaceae bacterium]|nr:YggS family pyridoxal phosphate-dependent enzyme [Planctomycetaceae bacterium]